MKFDYIYAVSSGWRLPPNPLAIADFELMMAVGADGGKYGRRGGAVALEYKRAAPYLKFYLALKSLLRITQRNATTRIHPDETA